MNEEGKRMTNSTGAKRFRRNDGSSPEGCPLKWLSSQTPHPHRQPFTKLCSQRSWGHRGCFQANLEADLEEFSPHVADAVLIQGLP